MGDTIVLLLDDDEIEDLIEGERDELEKMFTYARGAGTGERGTEMSPRQIDDATFNQATADSQVLSNLLRRVPPKPRTHAVDIGGRYSFRDELRHPEKSYRKREIPTRHQRVAFAILVDCSGSMCQMMDEVQRAVLGMVLAAKALDIPIAVWGFSSWMPPVRKVLDFDDGARLAPERIGGLVASGGTILSPALREVGKRIGDQKADRRIIIVVHDGQPSDMGESTTAVRELRRHAETVGILLGEEAEHPDLVQGMRTLFGDRLIAAKDAGRLMPLLGNFLVRATKSLV